MFPFRMVSYYLLWFPVLDFLFFRNVYKYCLHHLLKYSSPGQTRQCDIAGLRPEDVCRSRIARNKMLIRRCAL
jgi:hypothetical protein